MRDVDTLRVEAPHAQCGLERDRPWLTVVIPTHEGERWLAATLESLSAQTRSGFTCHLIDSSATEATIAIAARFSDRLDLRIEHRLDLPGWMEKTNYGFRSAATDHVCMLHQDDIWAPDRAAAVARWIEASPDVAMHLHASWIIDARNRRLGRWRCPLPFGANVRTDLLRDRLIVQNFVAICAPVIRRDAFLAVGGLDKELWYTADWDLYLKLAAIGPVAYHRECLTGFRIHADAQTVTGSRQEAAFRAQLTRVLERHRAGIAPRVMARARASIAMNAALATALHRTRRPLLRAMLDVVALGPVGAWAFFRDTRLVERVWPRLLAHLAGRLAR